MCRASNAGLANTHAHRKRALTRAPALCVRSETIMPMVEAQVKNQIPLHDLSNTSVSIAPADYSSWHEVRTELMGEAKAGLKARVEAELAAAADDNELKALRDRFAAEERAIEHNIDHQVHQFSCALEVEYNDRNDDSNPKPCPDCAPWLTRRRLPPCVRSSSPSRRPPDVVRAHVVRVLSHRFKRRLRGACREFLL